MRKLTIWFSALCLMALTISVGALEYDIEAPNGPEFGTATSVEPVAAADHCERANVDVSRNAALAPPAFGSASAYALDTGTPLTPNLAPGYMAVTGAAVGGSTVVPPDLSSIISSGTSVTPFVGYTPVTSDLYYRAGYLGTLKIPKLKVTVNVYQGTDDAELARGAGHFKDTSIWDGNVCIAGHNRGVNSYFGQIHTLTAGDQITLTTKLGTRTYAVTSVSKISETDYSMLAPTVDNCITLITCVRNQSAYRWCVRAAEVV